MAGVTKFGKSAMVNLMTAIAWPNAGTWDLEKVQRKVHQIQHILDDAIEENGRPKDEAAAQTLLEYEAAMERGDDLQVVEDSEIEQELDAHDQKKKAESKHEKKQKAEVEEPKIDQIEAETVVAEEAESVESAAEPPAKPKRSYKKREPKAATAETPKADPESEKEEKIEDPKTDVKEREFEALPPGDHVQVDADAKTPESKNGDSTPVQTEKTTSKPDEQLIFGGIRPIKSRHYLAAMILKRDGLSNGITQAMVDELDREYKQANWARSRAALTEVWHAVNGYERTYPVK